MGPPAERRGRIVAACAALAILAIALMLAWRSNRTLPVEREVSVWEPVGSWSGRGGSTQTDSFPGETGTFRVVWDAHGSSPDIGSIKITLYSAISGRPLSVAVDQHGPGGGTTFLNEDPRSFFFVVEAADLSWSLTAEEQVGVTQKRR